MHPGSDPSSQTRRSGYRCSAWGYDELRMKTPLEVWHLIERADERVKYAQNRPGTEPFRQARESLAQARSDLEQVGDESSKERLLAQIEQRLADIDLLETQTATFSTGEEQASNPDRLQDL